VGRLLENQFLRRRLQHSLNQSHPNGTSSLRFRLFVTHIRQGCGLIELSRSSFDHGPNGKSLQRMWWLRPCQRQGKCHLPGIPPLRMLARYPPSEAGQPTGGRKTISSGRIAHCITHHQLQTLETLTLQVVSFPGAGQGVMQQYESLGLGISLIDHPITSRYPGEEKCRKREFLPLNN
jgi:hypothetical protein